MIYFARPIESVKNARGAWNSLKVGVFKKDGEKEEKVGEYVRIYPNFYNTFFPFQMGGKDLALYSADYTCTRIMELPSCKDIGGEKPDNMGFCPVDFYVPSYADFEMDIPPWEEKPASKHRYRVEEPEEGDLAFTSGKGSRRLTGRIFHSFGFVAGCIWGDDSSWKIELLDLSRAHEGVLIREARFGYIEMPRHLDLKKAIQVNSDHDREPVITIATESDYDLKTGKREGQ